MNVDLYLNGQTQNSIALLKILAMSDQSLKQKKTKPIDQAFKDIKKRIKESQNK